MNKKMIMLFPIPVVLLIILVIGILISGKKETKILSSNIEISPTIIIPEIIIITETPVPTPTKRPTPTPTITPTPIPISTLDELFEKYSRSQSFSKETLKKIAVCESGFNPNARNGVYGGLFQFSESSWRNTRITMNQDPNPSFRFNPEEAIKTAAFKMATQGISAWPNCSK